MTALLPRNLDKVYWSFFNLWCNHTVKGDSILKFEVLINLWKIFSAPCHNDHRVIWASICNLAEIFFSGTCSYSFNVGSNICPQEENFTYKGASKLVASLQDWNLWKYILAGIRKWKLVNLWKLEDVRGRICNQFFQYGFINIILHKIEMIMRKRRKEQVHCIKNSQRNKHGHSKGYIYISKWIAIATINLIYQYMINIEVWQMECR